VNVDDTEWFDVVSTPTEKKARGPLSNEVAIQTREGEVVAEPGDYLIMEDDGNVYPIGPEKFDEYYRRADARSDGGDRFRCVCGAKYGDRAAALRCCTEHAEGNQPTADVREGRDGE
jgi:hypothetical protein